MKQLFENIRPYFAEYFFWLLVVSGLCLGLERLFAWRKDQPWNRPQIGQDVFFLVFNGHIFGFLLAKLLFMVAEQLPPVNIGILQKTEALRLLHNLPWLAQLIIFLIIKDFCEWGVHNILHRQAILWEFHKLHHSITQMDWIGNFRFHFAEVIVYRTLTWLPLLSLGPDPSIILPMAAIVTLIGHLNHANLHWNYGILRYVINSPRMHIWHHDLKCHYRSGQNFAIVFSIWDYLFKTAYFPEDKEAPDQLGFHGMANYPESLFTRLWLPFKSLLSMRGKNDKVAD